jgi:hypothetical protein
MRRPGRGSDPQSPKLGLYRSRGSTDDGRYLGARIALSAHPLHANNLGTTPRPHVPTPMPILTPDETAFLLTRCVQKLPAHILKGLQGSDEARRRATADAVRIMVAHLAEAGHEVVRPERRDGHMVDTPG